MRLQEWTIQEQDLLIQFMTTNSWPYHDISEPGRELLEKSIEEGGYASDDVKTFWIENNENEKVGIVKVYDLQEDVPLFDLRIADRFRGYGYGSRALKKLTQYVFELPEQKIRIEGHTRHDNAAMRKAFERAGFVKEAHLRQAWFLPKENTYYDAVTYGMTREDYLAGTTTPVRWEDQQRHEKSIPRFDESIATERLLMRAPELHDSMDVWGAVARSMPSLRRFTAWAQEELTIETTEEHVRQCVADFIARKNLYFYLFLKETGEFIGSVGLCSIDWGIRKFDLDYWLDTKFEGQGFMTEAVKALTDFAFEQLQAERVEYHCDEKHSKGRAVAKRSGFELEGILRKNALSANGQDLRNTCLYARII
ncbi:GNAT family N-acetyltransferase [Sporosarcina sp. PTS2304]|uniref:GNAT family N-acetyltransferase n=1 Tax=Sporosarcina sp. PTS2304 TaxID=2283194 RepID=UPI000E0D8708|nr:GNAT family N-acetyltransferase [Sporosarcina sp. PTS2304]AXI00314.1 GNAT family N-acetyltransferase [Sporosarcina sp. PTS2304]